MDTRRPLGVTVVAALMFLAAATYVVGAVLFVWAALAEWRGETLFFGLEVSPWYWVLNAVLDATLAVGFAYLGREVLAGSAWAGTTTTLLALASLLLGALNVLFGGGTGSVVGLLAIALSLLIVVLNNRPDSRAYYERSGR